MDDAIDYRHNTWEELQDALAHIDRERYPANFTALQAEIERRQHEPTTFAVNSAPKQNGCLWAFYGWLIGNGVGAIVGHIWFMILAAPVKAANGGYYGTDQWVYGWMGCVMICALVCSFCGTFIGNWWAGRRNNTS